MPLTLPDNQLKTLGKATNLDLRTTTDNECRDTNIGVTWQAAIAPGFADLPEKCEQGHGAKPVQVV